MKRSYLSSPYQKSRSYSPAVITQGGRVIWLAGHIASEDEDGTSLGGISTVRFDVCFASSVRR